MTWQNWREWAEKVTDTDEFRDLKEISINRLKFLFKLISNFCPGARILYLYKESHRCYTALTFGRSATQGWHSEKEITTYKARCARELAWSCLAVRWPAQLVIDLFGQHQRFAVCLPHSCALDKIFYFFMFLRGSIYCENPRGVPEREKNRGSGNPRAQWVGDSVGNPSSSYNISSYFAGSQRLFSYHTYRMRTKRPTSWIDRLLKKELYKQTSSVVEYILLCYFLMH